MDKEKECKCTENCTCEEDCKCDNDNKCNEECTCNNTCECAENCTGENECKCEEVGECEKSEELPPGKEKKHGIFNKKDKVKELEDKINELTDKELRQKAEFINYRKRKEDETARMLKYANEDIVKELLPTLDNFERAIDMDDDNLEDEVSKFLSGFKMIYCNLNKVLEKYGVTEIEALNIEFDPNVHQAVLTEKRDGIESGIVIEVLQKGYKLKDRVIRPAMVKVSE